jgi:hypothetical protein
LLLARSTISANLRALTERGTYGNGVFYDRSFGVLGPERDRVKSAVTSGPARVSLDRSSLLATRQSFPAYLDTDAFRMEV